MHRLCVKVESVEMYNPLSVRSGLFDILQFQLMKNAPAARHKATANTQVHLHFMQG